MAIKGCTLTPEEIIQTLNKYLRNDDKAEIQIENVAYNKYDYENNYYDTNVTFEINCYYDKHVWETRYYNHDTKKLETHRLHHKAKMMLSPLLTIDI